MVLCGDSAGTTNCIVVVQVIIQAQRISRAPRSQILFHGEQVLLHLPAGVAALSAYADMTHAMPSWIANAEKDYMPPINRTLLPSLPHCEIWPTKPPRVHPLCNDTILLHPLVSPIAVVDWTDFPPFWLCYGGEMMVDEGKHIAQGAAQRGAPVVWEQYDAMPHCFALRPPLNLLPQTQKLFEKWADFCRACVERPRAIKTRGTFTSADDMQETSVDVEHQLDLSFEEVKRRMEKSRMKLVELLSRMERSRTKL